MHKYDVCVGDYYFICHICIELNFNYVVSLISSHDDRKKMKKKTI